MDEGIDSDSISWNEMEDGKAPALSVGQEVEVSYNRKGRLMFDDYKGVKQDDDEDDD
jgi:hypothetical protein